MVRNTRANAKTAETRGAGHSDPPVVKTRRPHKKSHNGCIECKHRHIRCDERQPTCANCEIAERSCTYKGPQAGEQPAKKRRKAREKQQMRSQVPPDLDKEGTTRRRTGVDRDYAQESTLVLGAPRLNPSSDRATDRFPTPSPPEGYALPPLTSYNAKNHQVLTVPTSEVIDDSHTPPAKCLPGLSMLPDYQSGVTFTSHHMILLHHAPTVPNFIGTYGRNIVDIAISHITAAPYLFDEVLAFTAFHLSSLYPGSGAELGQLATQLQTRALDTFTQLMGMVEHDDKETAVPRFLFSSILGRHALADTLQCRFSGFHTFIERFADSINLNRGIIAVTPPAWDHLYNSEVQPFLRVVREAEEKIRSPGNECDALSRLIDESDLNDASIKAYRQAVTVLQRCFDVCHGLDEDDFPQAATSFSVRVQIEFVDLLRKQRPEALVILAYYGVILYRCRSFWAYRDAGVYLIRSIAEQLGHYWQEALKWPLDVLESDLGSGTSRLAPQI